MKTRRMAWICNMRYELNICWHIATSVLLLSSFGVSLPFLQQDIAGHGKIEDMVTTLNEQLLTAESDARDSRIFYMKNVTLDGEADNLPKMVFAQLLLSSGYENMKGIVSMNWNEIMSLRGPFDGDTVTQCNGVFYPDHLLSKVILENLINSNPLMEKKVLDELTKLFCNRKVKFVSMHYMQTDDVISGLIILSLMKDHSLLALANVGF